MFASFGGGAMSHSPLAPYPCIPLERLIPLAPPASPPSACQELLSRISSLPGGAQLVDTRPFVLPVRY